MMNEKQKLIGKMQRQWNKLDKAVKMEGVIISNQMLNDIIGLDIRYLSDEVELNKVINFIQTEYKKDKFKTLINDIKDIQLQEM